MDAERYERGIQVVEPRWKQVGVNGGELEAGVAQVNRCVKRCFCFLPLPAQPLFNIALVSKQKLFQLLERTSQGGRQVGYSM